jgi:hypothetical protein
MDVEFSLDSAAVQRGIQGPLRGSWKFFGGDGFKARELKAFMPAGDLEYAIGKFIPGGDTLPAIMVCAPGDRRPA